jgi:hypothetical protein
MTVDAARSCLGLGTCVGSSTRQIVVARVLLTWAAPPALPGRSVLGGLLAPPLQCDLGFIALSRSASNAYWSLLEICRLPVNSQLYRAELQLPGRVSIASKTVCDLADVLVWGVGNPQCLRWRSVITLVRRSCAGGRGGRTNLGPAPTADRDRRRSRSMAQASAARLARMDRQSLRDRVHRYNTEVIGGLSNWPAPGRRPKLTEKHMAAL